ncbi:MAG: hemolysin family protein [Bacteroidota bacterium]
MNPVSIILLSVLSSAFFSGIEIAFLTSNKLRVELESKEGFFPAKVLSFFMKNPQRFIAACLVGNNITLVIYGIYTSQLLEPVFHNYIQSHIGVLILSVLVSTFFIVVTAEFIPKALFSINPNAMLNFLAIPFAIIYFLLFPVVYITLGFAESLLKYGFRVNVEKSAVTFGRIDLDNYVKQFTSSNAHRNDFDHEIKIFQNALEFGSVKARECMIPRPELIGMEVNEDIKDLQEKFAETHLSKILIFEVSIDNIIGYVHSSEMFKRPKTIREILLPISIVPETMPAREILTLLKQQRRSVAVVVDEFGGTAGMLTIEDVMEEIFGEIDDEHDKQELTDRKVTDSEYLFSGRLEVDYINNKYQLELPIGEEYETLAGLILQYHGSMPVLNEVIEMHPFSFTVKQVAGNKIELVELKILE